MKIKKLLAVVLAVMTLALGGVFAACGDPDDEKKAQNGDSQPATSVTVYAPDGAPALALARLMSQEMTFGKEAVDYNIVVATTIQTYVSGESPQADIAILPVNAAAKVLGDGSVYQMLGVVTHGNLYALGKADSVVLTENNIVSTLVAGTKIGSLQLNNFVGWALRLVLDKYDIDYAVQTDPADYDETKVNLYEVTAAQIIPTADYDYMIAAEPAVSTKVSKTNGQLKVAGDLQALYGVDGYPQAVLVAKNTLIQNDADFVKEFIAAVDDGADWLLDGSTSAKTICEAVMSGKPDGSSPTFTEDNLTKSVIENCSVFFESAADAKSEVKDFLAKLSAVSGMSFSVSDGFFYRG